MNNPVLNQMFLIGWFFYVRGEELMAINSLIFRTAPHGGVIFGLNMLKILVFTVSCDESRLKTVITEQKIELASKGYHIICCHKSLATTDSCDRIQLFL